MSVSFGAHLLAVPALLMLGCSGKDEPPRGDVTDAASDIGQEDSAGDAATDTATASFGLCGVGFKGECAVLDLPLRHEEPGAGTVQVMLNRAVKQSAPKAQLWMLQGGPGGSAYALTSLAQQMGTLLPDFDVYLFEHRGVGLVDRLRCPTELSKTATDAEIEAYWKDCASTLVEKWSAAGLASFNSTEAAHDLADAIAAVSAPGQKVYVYGVSYGTYWAQRLLQLHADRVDGVILDSVVSPGVEYISQGDGFADDTITSLAELCKADASCTAAMGADPIATMKTVAAQIGAGSCAAAGTVSEVRAAARFVVSQQGFETAVFPLYARYRRCAPSDVAALQHAVQLAKVDGLAPPSSSALYFNVTFSELWQTPAPSVASLTAAATAALAPSEQFKLVSLQAAWPKYTRDPGAGMFPVTNKPVMVLAGTLDTQTPLALARAAKPHYSGPNQSFIELPNANHAVIAQSASTDATKPTCGSTLVVSWLGSALRGAPHADESCIPSIASPRFDWSTAVLTRVFGVPSAWGDGS